MVQEKFRFSVIGCGGYAGYLIDRLDELSDCCDLVAVTTRNPDSAVGKKFSALGVAVYQNPAELFSALSPEMCDVVIVPTSIESHFEYTKMAVESGFDVLLEKPPVATIQDLDELIELQRSSGRWIVVNFQFLFNEMSCLLKKRLAKGEFGRVEEVVGQGLWVRPESYFSRSNWSGRLRVGQDWILDGALGNPLAHLMAQILYLASGDPGMVFPTSVCAELYSVNDIESEDTNCIRAELENNVRILCFSSLCAEESGKVFCDIKTEVAQIRLIDFTEVEILFDDGRREHLRTDMTDIHLDRKVMLRAVVESLRDGRRPLITVEECRPYVQVWNAAFESAGVPVSILPEYIKTNGAEGDVARSLVGINNLTERACAEGKLYSEMNVPWGKSSSPVLLKDYAYFPSINKELAGCSGRIG